MSLKTDIKKRAVCTRCLRPQQTCICHWITPTVHAVEVLILQHPLEVANAKGSARLLHLSLPHSQLIVGETFAEQALHELLYAPFPYQEEVRAAPHQTILLYPHTPGSTAAGMQQAPLLDPAPLQYPEKTRLVILDSTWRKSRKMLYANTLLQALPRLPLQHMPASQYTIRKAHAPDQLSTLEASCYALMQLEGDEEKYQPLLKAFGGFVIQQSTYRAQASRV
ncbi:MAG TPA: tRNA-uridine aminocarboxypropyltransferase [Noviherbaspirillum sp.]|nr:tRNA-uridine aminocarboxypropyltransferase [Noviherbaspirillum sp.]